MTAGGRKAGEICVLEFNRNDPRITVAGFSGIEPIGRWTDGKRAALTQTVPANWKTAPVLLLRFRLRGFVDIDRLPEQRVTVSLSGVKVAEWLIGENYLRTHVLGVPRMAFQNSGEIRLGFELHDCVQPSAMGLAADLRRLAIMIQDVTIERAEEMPADDALFWHYGRPVGGEAAKSFDARIETGFWSRFVTGPKVLDVGFRGYGGKVLPILEGAIGIDLDYPGYDGRRLPFEDGSQDAVFSSHCLEHITDHRNAIQDWFRVTKTGGHIITIVPCARIYERKRRLPSRWNDDHKRFYSPASLLAEFEKALKLTRIPCGCWKRTTRATGMRICPTCIRLGAMRLFWSSRRLLRRNGG